MRRSLWSLGIAFLVFPALRAFAQVPDSLRVPITDAALRARLEAIAPSGARLFMLGTAGTGAHMLVPGDPGLARYQFGTEDFSTTSVTGQVFEPLGPTTLIKFPDGLEFVSGVSQSAVAELHLDNGVRWDGVLWWALDTSTGNLTLDLFEICWPFGAGTATITLLNEASTSGTPGDVIAFLPINPAVTVNNGLCTYMMLVSAAGPLDADLVFNRARAGWFRQVSPAPAVATFGDVPVGHPQFRFVEALAASGITAGCGSGNFCPDATLTRGQMAVFLAVALGLHFPF